jgi:hypothetical protein
VLSSPATREALSLEVAMATGRITLFRDRAIFVAGGAVAARRWIVRRPVEVLHHARVLSEGERRSDDMRGAFAGRAALCFMLEGVR